MIILNSTRQRFLQALKKYVFRLSFFMTLVLVMWSCANPGPLGGGPKDEEPPKYLGANPPQYACKVHKNKAVLYFNEFLSLQQLNQQLIVSPSIGAKPDIILRGKKLIIKQNKEAILLPNTTYTFAFGNAICDLHENNPLPNFQYVFSTGADIDTLSIRGSIADAFTLEPKQEVLVGLYRQQPNDSVPLDSLPLVQAPYYLARANDKGEFQLNNLAEGKYLLIALDDKNGNKYYDLPTESIAFSDTLVSPQILYNYIPDSIPIDTTNTTLMDSLWNHHAETTVLQPQNLFMFQKQQTEVKLLESKVEEAKKIILIFKNPLSDSISISLLGDTLLNDWYKEEYGVQKDSVYLWLQAALPDTINMRLAMDSAYCDTLQLVIRKRSLGVAKGARKRRPSTTPPKVKQTLKYKNTSQNLHHYYKPIHIVFETPIAYANFENIAIEQDNRTLQGGWTCRFTDSIHRHLEINYPWVQETNYKLIIPQLALRDMFAVENDSIILKFNTTKQDNYGSLALDFEAPQENMPYILQLEQGKAAKAKTIVRYQVQGDTSIVVSNLLPGDYYLKAIADPNANGKWDTGNYIEKQQAEAVYYLPKLIKIKAMWQNKEKWSPLFEHRKEVL